MQRVWEGSWLGPDSGQMIPAPSKVCWLQGPNTEPPSGNRGTDITTPATRALVKYTVRTPIGASSQEVAFPQTCDRYALRRKWKVSAYLYCLAHPKALRPSLLSETGNGFSTGLSNLCFFFSTFESCSGTLQRFSSEISRQLQIQNSCLHSN